jgi:hypothetical protein
VLLGEHSIGWVGRAVGRDKRPEVDGDDDDVDDDVADADDYGDIDDDDGDWCWI